MLPFRVHITDGMPVSEQLALAVRRAILAGELRDGEAFPSVRQMAQELKISPATIHKVVAELREAGLLAVRPGIGMVVVVPTGAASESRIEILHAAAAALLREAAMLQASLPEALEAVRRAAARANFPTDEPNQ